MDRDLDRHVRFSLTASTRKLKLNESCSGAAINFHVDVRLKNSDTARYVLSKIN